NKKLIKKNEIEERENEKLSNRQMRQLLMKNKKNQKRKKQNNKNVPNNEDISNDDSNDDSTDIINENKNLENIQNDKNDKNTNNVSNTDETDLEIKKSEDGKYEPQIVEYCKVCGAPYEYCEYGDSFSKCKEENKDKYNYNSTNTNGDDKNNKKQAKKATQQITQKIKIQKTSRAKKKVVTVVTGLHTYTKLDKMAKIFARFYACGASVIRGTNNGPDQIDIQGDVEYNLKEVIMKHCPELTEDLFVILPPK
ncbi:translation initiation factor SUI1, putative, partial [Hepatocystis sp. ex Piliocolobus tephrosceles]